LAEERPRHVYQERGGRGVQLEEGMEGDWERREH